MKHAKNPLLWAAIGLLTVSTSRVSMADTLTLTDGTQLAGTIRRSASGGWLVYQANGAVSPVAADQVSVIELTPPDNLTPAQAAQRLAGIRHWADTVREPAAAVRRYERFVQVIKDPDATAEAINDLTVWKDRDNRRMVKLGDTWYDPATDGARLDSAALTQADRARQLMKQGQDDAAQPLLEEAVAADPDAGTALYLLALLRIDKGDFPAARTSLDALLPLAPDHAPTLNNLAVVQWRQNQFLAALSSYDAALAADPASRLIIDNLAAALATTPDSLRTAPIYAQVLQDDQQREAQLVDRMSKRGLVRYGSAWIPAAQKQQIESQQKQARDQLNQLAIAFDAASKQAEALDTDILQTRSELHRLQAAAYMQYNPYGLAPVPIQFNIAPPAIYGNLQQDLQMQELRRDQQATIMAKLRQQAIDLQKQLSPPPFDSTQRIIGLEGTPMIASAH